ncbi:class I SAM-dependent methyltransferase [Anaerocolumna jejuensis]|uniref:class I SAM-dependent methyltransferase n=1 Tax=Anaerocolumna jejuensis TaxID=259063 RepID=UPI003F7C3543
MKENKYDQAAFFAQYAKMERSEKGLIGAGEWYIFKDMLPDFAGKHVLDLGCGYGWHCRYIIEEGAASVTGIDISKKMLSKAKEINLLEGVNYKQAAIEDVEFPDGSFDIIISSLAFHYIQSYDTLIQNVYHWLRAGGSFVFSVEHPVFTAEGGQDWEYDGKGNKLHWKVDRYFYEEKRDTSFLGEKVVKYHRTITTYINELLKQGFKILSVKEPIPAASMMERVPEMQDELRRPMMLLVAAEK